MKLSILGSTGSIGTQALEVCGHIEEIEVVGLSAHSNITLLEQQARKFKVKQCTVFREDQYKELKGRLKDTGICVSCGMEGLIQTASVPEADTVLTSVVGSVGLLPTVTAIEEGKNIALANKETLVMAGALVTKLAKEKGVQILPVDSEHCAVFQCLHGNQPREVERIILTASGGPFFGWDAEKLKSVTPKMALLHPNWDMGGKITIDSATMMNKGLEIIEARWLFGTDKIDAIVHRESIVHSMVEFTDGSVIAQLGVPDMRLPIQYALTYPKRTPSLCEKLSLTKIGTLSFCEPDIKTFRCLQLALDALQIGGSMPCVMNGANEAAVELFLLGKIGFADIWALIEETMNNHKVAANPNLKQLLEFDQWARMFARSLL